ncbi:MAG: DUF4369 domain-containing protein [Prevotellaceae bacterium]|nr:DUF4369 domain-containing protein [Prevotellaceae bacterium]
MQNPPAARHSAFRRAAASARRVLGAGTTAFLLLLSVSCGDEGAFVLEGKFRGVADAQFYIYSQDDFRGIDTLRVASDGSFRYTARIDEPTVLTVLYPNFSTTLVVAAPGDKLSIDADASHLAELQVSGSDENEHLSALRRRLSGLGTAETQRVVAAFVRENPQSAAAAALVRKHFLEAGETMPDTLAALLGVLRRGGAKGRIFAALEADAAVLFPAGTATAGPLRLAAADGRPLTFPDKARPTIVFFWATWNHESVLALHRFAALSRRRRADAAFIAVAIDEDSARVRQYLERDTLLSCGIADGQAFGSPLARCLGFGRLPEARMVDSRGRLVAVSADPETLVGRQP